MAYPRPVRPWVASGGVELQSVGAAMLGKPLRQWEQHGGRGKGACLGRRDLSLSVGLWDPMRCRGLG